jgi:hypothetical protein
LKRAARAARIAALLGAPQAHRGLSRTGFAAALVVFVENSHGPDFASGGTRQGRFLRRRGAQPEGRRAYSRASSSDLPHLSERSGGPAGPGA